MAGEWVPYDVCLPQKPEVLELADRTGLSTDQIVGRLVMLWGWASLNSSDGSARVSIRLLGRLCGGDEEFWYAVQDVGWLVIDADNGTVSIPGWERRFSKSAKSRALAAVRHDVDKAGGATRPGRGRSAPPRGAPRAPERRDRGDRISSSSPGEAAPPEPGAGAGAGAGPDGWETLAKAWREGTGRPWKLPTPPAKAGERLAEDGWFEKALAAIQDLPRCRFFRDPVTLPQFLDEGFVDKILGGQFDNPRTAPPGAGGRPAEPAAPAPLSTWSTDEIAKFEAVKRQMADRIRQEGAA